MTPYWLGFPCKFMSPWTCKWETLSRSLEKASWLPAACVLWSSESDGVWMSEALWQAMQWDDCGRIWWSTAPAFRRTDVQHGDTSERPDFQNLKGQQSAFDGSQMDESSCYRHTHLQDLLWRECEIISHLPFYHKLKCSIPKASKKNSQYFEHNFQIALRWSECSIPSPALSSSRHAGAASLAPSLAMTPAHAGSGSHLAVPGSDLSNQMELAKHHKPASALSRSRGRGRARRNSGREVCRWLITTHIRSPHFLQHVLSLKRADCLIFGSLLAPVCRLRSLILTPKSSVFSSSWRRPSKKRSCAVLHLVSSSICHPKISGETFNHSYSTRLTVKQGHRRFVLIKSCKVIPAI